MRILVLSPRIPVGLMTAAAWDAVRGASSVVAAADGPHVHALREAGVDVRDLATKHVIMQEEVVRHGELPLYHDLLSGNYGDDLSHEWPILRFRMAWLA